MKKVVGKYCPECQGVRPHTSEVRELLVSGKKTRCWVCAMCDHQTLQEGFFCGDCGHDKFVTLYTRRPTPGVVRRVKQCRKCPRRFRTIERIEAMAMA